MSPTNSLCTFHSNEVHASLFRLSRSDIAGHQIRAGLQGQVPRHQVPPPNHPTASCLPLLLLLPFLYSILLLHFVNCTVNPSLRADLAHNSRISIPLDILALTLLSSIRNATPGRFPPEAIACSRYQVSSSPAAAFETRLAPSTHAFHNYDVLSVSFFNPSSHSDQPPPYSLLKVVRGRLVCHESFIQEQGVAEERTTKFHLCNSLDVVSI